MGRAAPRKKPRAEKKKTPLANLSKKERADFKLGPTRRPGEAFDAARRGARGEVYLMLPWPPRELSPNARVPWRAHARMVQVFRERCYWATYDQIALGSRLPDGPLRLSVTGFPPDFRRRDLDNLAASLKAAIDGVFQFFEADDSRIESLLVRKFGPPCQRGAVLFVLAPDPESLLLRGWLE